MLPESNAAPEGRGPEPALRDVRVCSFESRKGADMRSLLERHGATVTIAPSMREVPLAESPPAFEFAEKLLAGDLDVVVLLTGVGTRALWDLLATRHDRAPLCAALGRCEVIVRGPKPAAVLREWGVRFGHQAPEPNTWRELIQVIDAEVPVAGRAVAVQEYGQPNPELYAALESRGAAVLRVPVYRWAAPLDLGPLTAAIEQTVRGEFDVLLFTSAFQLHSVLSQAESLHLRDAFLAAAQRCVIGSIGPTASETLTEAGLPPDFEPEHPKMGHLVLTLARTAREHLARQREDFNQG